MNSWLKPKDLQACLNVQLSKTISGVVGNTMLNVCSIIVQYHIIGWISQRVPVDLIGECIASAQALIQKLGGMNSSVKSRFYYQINHITVAF